MVEESTTSWVDFVLVNLLTTFDIADRVQTPYLMALNTVLMPYTGVVKNFPQKPNLFKASHTGVGEE